MILETDNLLTSQELAEIRAIASKSTFVDGRLSNPHNKTKNNQQIEYSSPGYQETTKILLDALTRNQDFRNYALPVRIAPPLLCSYHTGMHYGIHSDSAYISLPPHPPLKSDLSVTIFLTDPDEYDGGELTLHLGSKPVSIKLAAGGAVFYPSTTLHEVTPVTRGKRLVAITFVESQISDERQRHMVYTLGEISALEGFNMKHENRARLGYVKQNLIRMWS